MTVPVIYKVTSRYWGVLAGLGAAILLLFSNYHQQFAHEARAYALLAFLATVSVYTFMKLCEGESDKRTRWLYVLSTVAMLYTHFFGVAVLLIELSVLVFSAPWRKRWPALKGPLLYTLLLFLPYVGLFVYRSFLSVSQGTWVRHLEDIKEVAYITSMMTNRSALLFVVLMTLFWLATVRQMNQMFQNKALRTILLITCSFIFVTFCSYYVDFPSIPVDVHSKVYELLFLVGFGLIFVCVFFSSKVKPEQRMLLLWLFAPLIGMYIVSYKAPMYLDRYVFYSTPPFYILCSLAILQLDRGVAKVALIMMCVVFFMEYKPKAENADRVPSAFAQKVAEYQGNGTKTLICPPYYDLTLAYHLDSDLYIADCEPGEFKRTFDDRMKAMGIFALWNAGQVDWRELEQAPEILFMDAHSEFTLIGNGIMDSLNVHFSQKEELLRQHDFALYRFSH